MVEYVLRAHFRLAADSALLFAVGLFLSWPIVHYRLELLTRLPLAVFHLVLRLIGTSPSIARTAAVVFCFNSVVIFAYMASGFHPLLPKVFGIWIGMNVGIIIGMVGRRGALPHVGRPAAGQWVPPASLTAVCGALVLMLELPCFWFAVAMGISMGHTVQAGAEPYLSALALRAQAYLAVIVPALAVSAIAEAIAVRGPAGRVEQTTVGQVNHDEETTRNT